MSPTFRARLASCALVALIALFSVVTPTAPARARPLTSIYDTGATTALSIYAGVPVYLDVDHDIVRPGYAFDGRFGIDVHYVSFDFEMGFQGNAVDGSKSDPPPFDRETLRRVHVGFGLRLQIPNETRLLPYVSGAFDCAWWHLNENQIVIGNGVIFGYPKFNFAPGFSGRAGFAIRTGTDVYVDLALGFGMSFPGGFFDQNRYWLSPQIGFTYRR